MQRANKNSIKSHSKENEEDDYNDEEYIEEDNENKDYDEVTETSSSQHSTTIDGNERSHGNKHTKQTINGETVRHEDTEYGDDEEETSMEKDDEDKDYDEVTETSSSHHSTTIDGNERSHGNKHTKQTINGETVLHEDTEYGDDDDDFKNSEETNTVKKSFENENKEEIENQETAEIVKIDNKGNPIDESPETPETPEMLGGFDTTNTRTNVKITVNGKKIVDEKINGVPNGGINVSSKNNYRVENGKVVENKSTVETTVNGKKTVHESTNNNNRNKVISTMQNLMSKANLRNDREIMASKENSVSQNIPKNNNVDIKSEEAYDSQLENQSSDQEKLVSTKNENVSESVSAKNKNVPKFAETSSETDASTEAEESDNTMLKAGLGIGAAVAVATTSAAAYFYIKHRMNTVHIPSGGYE